MKKWLQIFFINTVILFSILTVLTVPIYFYGVHTLNSFFTFEDEHSDYYKSDSTAMFIHQPNVEISFDWSEHPNGVITFITNNLGFRENNDISIEKPADQIRVLVTGDSHTDGVVFNQESFPNVMEKQFNDLKTNYSYEVINGGTGFYSFKNYYGFIEKYKILKPDYFVINVFTGNDFRETLLYEQESKSYSNVLKNAYFRAKRRVFLENDFQVPMNQGLDQHFYFSTFPRDIKKAIDYAKLYTAKIDSLCRSENINLVITLLPSKTETNNEFRAQISSEFDWSENELSVNSRLTTSYQNWLISNGIRTLPLKDTLSSPAGKVFWDEDLHINEEAHKRIGEFLANHLFD